MCIVSKVFRLSHIRQRILLKDLQYSATSHLPEYLHPISPQRFQGIKHARPHKGEDVDKKVRPVRNVLDQLSGDTSTFRLE